MKYSKLLMRNDSLTNNAHVSLFSPPQLLIYRTLNRVAALTTHRLSYRRLGHSWAMQQPPARVNSKTADKKLTLNKLVGTLSTVRSSNNIMCSGKRRKTRFCLFHSHHKLTTRLSSHLFNKPLVLGVMVHLVRVRVVQPMTSTRFSITVCSSDLKSRSAQVKIEAPKIAIESISIGNHYKCLGIGSLTNRSHGAVPTFHVNRSRRTQIKGIKFDHNKCNYRSATLISLCQVVICALQRTDSRNRHHRLALERCKNLYLMYATCH